MAKKAVPKVKEKKGVEVDPASGYRTNTKKYCVYLIWFNRGETPEALKAALGYMGKHTAVQERQTKASVYSWFKEFTRRGIPRK